ncbi:polysaccharide deacetylase family protein [Thalassotalea atypica]|uniref:polysaccharide deacetylase family protein n=1 Tax=Thalassotalea atypica TaxID=2054316 RepID=UPI0025737D48|nr:polysaccharide deacetylase family protein [Thalassotalea atypica]
MSKTHSLLLTFCLSSTCGFANSGNVNTPYFTWPNKAKIAVSLSYDDALDSHLDNAIPSLNHFQLHGSFYLTMNANSIYSRLKEWQQAAIDGHELGNHTLYHYCSSSGTDRGWVKPHQNLNNISMEALIDDIKLTNSFLYAIDGQTLRTYTAPCADEFVDSRSYYPLVEHLFVGMKTHVLKTPIDKHTDVTSFSPLRGIVWVPNAITGEQLIAHVQKIKTIALDNDQPVVANITFHGIGGDHLSVSKHAHNQLLRYLANHSEHYWVDTYRNISIYMNQYNQRITRQQSVQSQIN